MEINQLMSGILKATAEIERVDISRGNSRRYVAVYADGSISPVLDQHTWEGGRPVVVCEVNPWFDSASSKKANSVAKREEMGWALRRAEQQLADADFYEKAVIY